MRQFAEGGLHAVDGVSQTHEVCELGHEDVHQVGVEGAAALLDQHAQSLLVRERRAVATIHGQGIEAVDDGDDAPGQWDVGSGQAARVAAAVPALVMRQRHLGRQAKQRDARSTKDLGAHLRMAVHHGALRRREGAGLLQHGVGDADLAHVMHGRRLAEHGRPGDGLAGSQRQALGQEAHAHDVRAGVRVAELGRQGQAEQGFVVRLRHLQQRLIALAVQHAQVAHHALHLGGCCGVESVVVHAGAWLQAHGMGLSLAMSSNRIVDDIDFID